MNEANLKSRIQSIPLEMAVGHNYKPDLNSNFLNSNNAGDNEDDDNESNFIKFAANEADVRLGDKRSVANDIDAGLVKLRKSSRANRASSRESSVDLAGSINENLAVATTYRIWNPLRWFVKGEGSMEDIESRILKCVKTPFERYYVNIRNNSLKIWTLSANRDSTNTPIVLVHGFCGAVGLWIHNIDELSDSRPFYAFDLLGFGRSSRPLFSSDPIVAETQFIESIEDWRKELNLQEFILLGHSFGGYLATAYAIKYPNRVKGLILADPWGFPEKPSTNRGDTPLPLWIRVIARVIQYVSPLAVIRVTGQLGVNVFKHLRPDFRNKYCSILDEPDLIYTYIYYANSLPPSGEYGFKAIAEFFGYAKNPMIKRIQNVDNNIPVWFIYGARSWIDHTAGFTSVNLRQNSISTTVKLITNAGHHVYADRPREFNEYVNYIFKTIDELTNPDNSSNLNELAEQSIQVTNPIMHRRSSSSSSSSSSLTSS